MHTSNDTSHLGTPWSLSEANLKRHDDALEAISVNIHPQSAYSSLIRPKVDRQFMESQIKSEATVDFDRALYEYFSIDEVEQSDTKQVMSAALRAVKRQNADELITTATRHYNWPSPYSPSSMKRFCALSTTDDPIPMMTREAIKKTGICPSSLEHIDTRAIAAGKAAEYPVIPQQEADVIEVDSEDGSWEADFNTSQYRHVRQPPQMNQVRVKKNIKIRKRGERADAKVDRRK